MSDENKIEDGNQPAFPVPPTADGYLSNCPLGMTLRQWYAGMALQGLLAEGANPNAIGSWQREKEFADIAFRFADAMIAVGKAKP